MLRYRFFAVCRPCLLRWVRSDRLIKRHMYTGSSTGWIWWSRIASYRGELGPQVEQFVSKGALHSVLGSVGDAALRLFALWALVCTFLTSRGLKLDQALDLPSEWRPLLLLTYEKRAVCKPSIEWINWTMTLSRQCRSAPREKLHS